MRGANTLGAARWVSAVVAVLLVLSLGGYGAARATTGDIGYQGQSYSGVSNPPTSDKPQSKLWYNDGSWWANMFDSASQDWHIFRLDRSTQQWVDTGTLVDPRASSLSDALWDGNRLYIASHYVTVSSPSSPKAAVKNQPAYLYRYSYSPGTRSYQLDPGFPAQISNYSSESMTIDKDSRGVLWATWTQVSGSSAAGFTSTVYVNSTSGADQTWGTPRAVPVSGANPAPDDISAVVAYGQSKIGILWSNQLDDTVYWAWRNDSEPATSWHGGLAARGPHLADDHMNLKSIQADSSGRVFAVVKNSMDEVSSSTSSNAQLDLLVFKPGTGSWTSTPVATVADCHTRPIVMLDTTNSLVRVFATAPSSGGCPYSGAPGTIYEKSAPLDNPVFAAGRGTPVIRDVASANVNNVTSTKQSVTAASGLVVLASNHSTKRYWHADLSLGSAPAAPTASFTASATSGTAPLSVQLSDTSTGGPTSWSWNLGDGTTSTAQNPSVTYSTAGTYTVTLTASNAGGSSAPASQTITVTAAPAAPTASFTASATSGTAPLSVQLSDTSTGGPTSWSWNLGDGTTSTAQNPSVTYSTAGTYTVTLTASNAGGSSAPASQTITVTAAPAAPTASFTASATSGTAPLSVQLSDTSTGGPTSWSWDLGNGTTSTAQNPSVTYSTAGTYTVTLTASNASGYSAPASQTITVSPASSGGIVREAVATTAVTTATNGITIAKPPGTAAGDVLVSCVALNGSYVTPGGVPEGWSPLVAATSASNPKVYGYYKVAASSEPADYRWTFGSSITSGGGIARYSGSSGPDGEATEATGGSSKTATVPGVTTTTADTMLVGCMGINSGATSLTISSPGGMTEAWDIGGKRHELADGPRAAAGPTGDRTWTFSAGRPWAGWLVALRPR